MKYDNISSLTVSGIPFCRKSMRVSQSRFSPLSCFSWPISQWPAKGTYREKLGMAYMHVFYAEWSNAECGNV